MRLLPARAGISASQLTRATSDGLRPVVDVHRLPLRVDVERLGPRLARAVAGVAKAAEGQVRLTAEGRPVDHRDTRLHAGDEGHRAVQAGGVDGADEAEWR